MMEKCFSFKRNLCAQLWHSCEYNNHQYFVSLQSMANMMSEERDMASVFKEDTEAW